MNDDDEDAVDVSEVHQTSESLPRLQIISHAILVAILVTASGTNDVSSALVFVTQNNCKTSQLASKELRSIQ